jgi:hypothetical protein
MKTPPKTLTIHGVCCDRVGNPIEINGKTWDTYIPAEHESDDVQDLIYERARETGRIIQTRGEGS